MVLLPLLLHTVVCVVLSRKSEAWLCCSHDDVGNDQIGSMIGGNHGRNVDACGGGCFLLRKKTKQRTDGRVKCGLILLAVDNKSEERYYTISHKLIDGVLMLLVCNVDCCWLCLKKNSIASVSKKVAGWKTQHGFNGLWIYHNDSNVLMILIMM